MKNIHKHHIFCIEGPDNVGKTTLIQKLNNDIYPNKIYKKYPTESIEIKEHFKFMNYIKNNVIHDIDDNTIKEKILYRLYAYTITVMAHDMNISGEILNPYDDQDIIISDRGPLSTFLYQFREYENIISKQNNTIESSLRNFINDYDLLYIKKYLFVDNNICYSSINHILQTKKISIHNILLYSSTDIDLIVDEDESEQYKKDFDKNILLQNRIKKDIIDLSTRTNDEGIIEYINNTERHINDNFSIIPINIIKEEVPGIYVRKTPIELAIEVKKIINYYESKGELIHEYI